MALSSSSSCMIFCFFSMILLLINATKKTTAGAEEFTVGNGHGWRQPPVNESSIYSFWASRRKFHVGDSLRFVYKNDSVQVVDKWGYYHCNSSQPISVFRDGNTVVVLDKVGSAYFISGDPNHCKNEQRLLIEVLPVHPPVSPPAPAKPRPPHVVNPPAASPAPAASNSGGRSFGSSVSVLGAHVLAVVVVSVLG